MEKCEHDFRPVQSGGSDHNPFLCCNICGAMLANPYAYFKKQGREEIKKELLEWFHNSEMDGEEVGMIIDKIKSL